MKEDFLKLVIKEEILDIIFNQNIKFRTIICNTFIFFQLFGFLLLVLNQILNTTAISILYTFLLLMFNLINLSLIIIINYKFNSIEKEITKRKKAILELVNLLPDSEQDQSEKILEILSKYREKERKNKNAKKGKRFKK